MQQIFRIIKGNIDERVKSLLMESSKYLAIQATSDPIKLIELLREVCSKEKGVDYSVASFHQAMTNLLNFKQNNDDDVAYMKSINLRFEVITTTQFGED